MPAVAEKLTDVEPVGTETVAGTVNASALLERLMVAPPAGAALDSVTEQAAVPVGFKLVGEQETEVRMVMAINEIDAVEELPLYDAVTTAD